MGAVLIDPQEYPWIQARGYAQVRHLIKAVHTAYTTPATGLSPLSGYRQASDRDMALMLRQEAGHV